jgi:pimeloyl-ACP methyl ester carboxylesterase
MGSTSRQPSGELNGFAHYRAQVGGATVHFVQQRARHGGGVPLILGHGWPSCFAELLPLVPLLTDPAGHGIAGRPQPACQRDRA